MSMSNLEVQLAESFPFKASIFPELLATQIYLPKMLSSVQVYSQAYSQARSQMLSQIGSQAGSSACSR